MKAVVKLSFHGRATIPVPEGARLLSTYTKQGEKRVRRPMSDEKSNCIAGEELTQRDVVLYKGKLFNSLASAE